MSEKAEIFRTKFYYLFLISQKIQDLSSQYVPTNTSIAAQ